MNLKSELKKINIKFIAKFTICVSFSLKIRINYLVK